MDRGVETPELNRKRTCSECGKKFASIRARKQHEIMKHAEPREKSIAMSLIDYQLDRAMGGPVDEEYEDMI